MNATQPPEEQQTPAAAPPDAAAPLPPPQAPPAPAPVAAPPPRRYSPGLVVVLSFLPGLGHLYLGLYQRGIVFFLCFASGIWLADHADLGILIPFVWFFCLIDAYRQAQAANQGMAAPSPATSPGGARRGGSLGFGIFLTVLGAILLYNQFYPLDLSFLVDWWPLLLVIAGIYLLIRHFVEDKRRRDREEDGETS
jgi:LiaI-LiaF-like transmembrane region